MSVDFLMLIEVVMNVSISKRLTIVNQSVALLFGFCNVH